MHTVHSLLSNVEILTIVRSLPYSAGPVQLQPLLVVKQSQYDPVRQPSSVQSFHTMCDKQNKWCVCVFVNSETLITYICTKRPAKSDNCQHYIIVKIK